jgi:putative serine/threonine protein kinase
MVSKKGVYIIDFDKAREHSPKNFTSAMSLLFGENYISKKIMHLLNLSEEKIILFRKYAKNYKTLFKN